MSTCPLCQHSHTSVVRTPGDKRTYRNCAYCNLIFVNDIDFPDPQKARHRYEKHQNNIQDTGYVSFLNQIVQAAKPFLRADQRGLDFGCGPSPTLSIILKNEGFHCQDYDPVFYPTNPVGPFDFIFSTECFEHFASPKTELSRITSLLAKGGILAVMTDMWESENAFSTWYYKRDFTHLVFYHRRTFDYIAKQFGYDLLLTDNKRVVVLKKN